MLWNSAKMTDIHLQVSSRWHALRLDQIWNQWFAAIKDVQVAVAVRCCWQSNERGLEWTKEKYIFNKATTFWRKLWQRRVRKRCESTWINNGYWNAYHILRPRCCKTNTDDLEVSLTSILSEGSKSTDCQNKHDPSMFTINLKRTRSFIYNIRKKFQYYCAWDSVSGFSNLYSSIIFQFCTETIYCVAIASSKNMFDSFICFSMCYYVWLNTGIRHLFPKITMLLLHSLAHNVPDNYVFVYSNPHSYQRNVWKYGIYPGLFGQSPTKAGNGWSDEPSSTPQMEKQEYAYQRWPSGRNKIADVAVSAFYRCISHSTSSLSSKKRAMSPNIASKTSPEKYLKRPLRQPSKQWQSPSMDPWKQKKSPECRQCM